MSTKTTQQLAEEYAKNETVNAGNDTQALLAQYEKIAEQQKQALNQQKELASSRINAQRDDVMKSYNDNARQAYINSMLGKKSVEQELSRAGLNTSGLVGSAYANVENAYGNNLATLQASRDKSINDINRQLNESQMQYAIQENQLLADIENAKLELQKYGNQLAYQKYQDALANYMNFANYDYNKAVDERNYNYQLERDKVADEQWKQQYDYQVNRDNVADSQWKQQYDYQVGRDKVADEQWKQQYDYQVNRDNVADSQWKQQYDYQVGRDTVADNQWQKEYDFALQQYADSLKKNTGSGSRSSGGIVTTFSDQPSLSNNGQKILNMINSAKNNSSGSGVISKSVASVVNNKDLLRKYIENEYNKGNISPEDGDILFSQLGL